MWCRHSKVNTGIPGREIICFSCERGTRGEAKTKTPQEGGERDPWKSRCGEKDRNTQSQETEVVTGRGGRRGSNQEGKNTRVCPQTETCWGKKMIKKEGHRRITEETDKNRKYLKCITWGRHKTIIVKKMFHPN